MSGYDGTRWRALRKRKLRANPICEHEDGCDQASTDVHHRDGLGLDGPLGYEWGNLQALCHSHHSKHTAQHQPGGWNRAQRTPRKRPAPKHPGLVQ